MAAQANSDGGLRYKASKLLVAAIFTGGALVAFFQATRTLPLLSSWYQVNLFLCGSPMGVFRLYLISTVIHIAEACAAAYMCRVKGVPWLKTLPLCIGALFWGGFAIYEATQLKPLRSKE